MITRDFHKHKKALLKHYQTPTILFCTKLDATEARLETIGIYKRALHFQFNEG